MHAPVLPPFVTIGVGRRGASSPSARTLVGTSPVQAAVAAFGQLDQVCATAVTAVNAATFGPFGGSGDCTYDCGFMEQDWSWSVDYTAWTKTQNLLPAIQAVDCSAAFGNAFAPTGQWRDAGLPADTTSFTTAMTTILQIDAAVVAQGGVATPEQVQALTQAFTQAFAAASSSNGSVNGAIQTMASFQGYEQGFTTYLPGVATSCASALTASINDSCQNLIGQLACGDGDVQGQFNAMQVVVTASFASLQGPFANAGAQLGAALQASGQINGSMLNVQTDLSGLVAEVTKAQGYDPASPLRTMHLNIAVNDWTAMQTYAQQQLAA